MIPEETKLPPELAGLDDDKEETSSAPIWIQALLNPYVQSVHLSMVRHRSTDTDETPSPSLNNLRERLIKEGPQVLNSKEKLRLLWDAETVFWLHHELWSRPSSDLHPSWLKFQADNGTSLLLTQYLLPR